METEMITAPENTEATELGSLERKMKFTGTVVKTTLAGAVVDIGLEVPGVVHISQLQEGSVNRVEDVIQPGQTIEVWIRRVFPKKKRIELTMLEPLELEWREITKGMVLKGKVTRIENFGAFVDIGAERPGLVHISELTHDYIKNVNEVVKENDEVEVQVLSVNRHKRQIKLSMKALEERPEKVVKESHGPSARTQEEPAKDEPVPTAMEMALREAMERSKGREDEAPVSKSKKKGSSSDDEIEKILARTLENRARTK